MIGKRMKMSPEMFEKVLSIAQSDRTHDVAEFARAIVADIVAERFREAAELDPKMSKIVRDNAWDLYETD